MPVDRDPGLRRLGVAAWSMLGTILLLGVLGWLLLRVWIIIPPLLLAIAIIYVLNPVVNVLHRRGVARWIGSCLSYLALAGLLTLAGFLVIPGIAEQGRELAEDFPTIYGNLIGDVEGLTARVGFEIELPNYERLRRDIGNGTGFFGSQLDRITDVTLGILEAVFIFLLAPVVAFYVLLDLPTIRRKALDLVPERHRDEAAHVGRALGTAVGGFLRGQLLVALIVGVMSAFGLWLIGVPFWLLIGLIAGFLNIIPLIGPWVGGLLGVLVALATRDLQTALYAGLVAVVVQQIDNNLVSPIVLRATVRLHPASIILGLVAGAAIAGFWGMLLTVPIMASVKIIAGHFWRTRVLGQSWEETIEALIDEHPTGETPMLRRRRAPEGEPDESEPPPPPLPPEDGGQGAPPIPGSGNRT